MSLTVSNLVPEVILHPSNLEIGRLFQNAERDSSRLPAHMGVLEESSSDLVSFTIPNVFGRQNTGLT
jgi:hypothetical protein